MKQSFLILLACFPLWLMAQSAGDHTISLSATLLDEADKPLPYVTVTNLSSHQGVVSDDEGFFYVHFDKKDTLELSAVGFEKYQLYFGDTATADNYDLSIRLSEKTYQLENVTVFAYKDEEAFKKAILALDNEVLPKEKTPIKVPGTYQGPRTEKRPGLVSSPLSFIYDRFSKRARYERKAREAEKEYEYQKILDKKFNRDMVGKVTGLKNDELDAFMLYCRLEDTFVEQSTEYDIIVAVNRCYENFRHNTH